MFQLLNRDCCGLEVVMWVIANIFCLLLLIAVPLFAVDFPDSAVSAGMGNAYSVVGHDNGLLQVNPATIADTHPLYSVNLFFGRSNDYFNLSYAEISALDSTGELSGGAYYGRIFNYGEGESKVKIDNAYFALSEHYSESLYFGIGVKWIKDYVEDEKGWELTAGMMAKLGDYFRIGIAGYNLLPYRSPYFPGLLEFSIGSVVDSFLRGEVDYLQDLDAGWDKDSATVKAGIEFVIREILGITGGWQWEGFSHHTFSGGIFWRYPRGIVAYSFSSSQRDGERHTLSVEIFIFQ